LEAASGFLGNLSIFMISLMVVAVAALALRRGWVPRSGEAG
jgi:hypothetical protein